MSVTTPTRVVTKKRRMSASAMIRNEVPDRSQYKIPVTAGVSSANA